MDSKFLFIPAAGFALLLAVTQSPAQSTPASAQATTTPAPTKAAAPTVKTTVAKPMTEKQQKAKEALLKKELETPYKKWLDEDVVYIISDEEKKAFHQLNTDEEREQFVEQFWLRRDPTPDTEENEFKEEHYRRIAYANEHFASGIPGWRTDRGRIYIEYGPPDEIEAHSSGGSYERPMSEGGGGNGNVPVRAVALPVYRWRGAEHYSGIRGQDHVGRISHDDGSFRKRRAAECAECRFDAL